MVRLLAALPLALALHAQVDAGAAGLHQALKRLTTDIRILHVTAHPDDEDAALLTTLSRKYGYRVAILSLNRGEGGANLAGAEMYDALGVLRTEEMLAAARRYGVELYYARTVDFGFSKRMDETLEHWGKQNVLDDVVRFVKRWKPDIVVARFHGKDRDGHGNHQTAGLMAIEAFRAVPEVKKLYLSTRAGEPSTLQIPTGDYDPLLGTTYRELALDGYRQHRTQGMAAIPALRGPAHSTLQLVENRVGPVGPEPDISAGLKPPATPLAFDATAPGKLAPQLARGLKETGRPEWQDALNRALAIRIDALADSSGPVVPGQKFSASVNVAHAQGVEPVSIALRAPAGWTVTERSREGTAVHFDVTVPDDAKLTRPHWSRKSELRDYLYTIDEPEHEFLPFAPPPVTAEFRYRIAGVEAVATAPVETQTLDRLWGPQRRSLAVAPALSVSVSPRTGLIPNTRGEYKLQVQMKADAPRDGTLRLRLPSGWSSAPESAPVALARPGDVQTYAFTLKFPPGASGTVSAVVEVGGKQYTDGYQTIGYRGLEPRHLFRPATLHLRSADVRYAPNLRVGYIAGAGDETAAALQQLGIPVETVAPDADLSRFTAVVIGVRASAVRDDWKKHRENLLKYAAAGGHVVVQYQTQEFDEAPYGPYPYKLTARAEEVSEEAAAVTILVPQHPVFQSPNRITAADFDNWVEERGSKWMTEWDGRYTALLESHDRGQPPQKGGMLIAPVGKGYWTYAAYAFYRQLHAGVPGAYRLFTNLLSLTAASK